MVALRQLYHRMLGMIGVGYVRLVKDDGDQQLVQVEMKKGGPDVLNELIDDLPRLGHYGIYYRPPFGSEVVAFFLGGKRSNGFVMATGHRETRPRDLEEGECMLMNTLTGAFVKMSADGKIRSQGDWEHTGSFSATQDILDHSAANTATMKVHRDAFNAHKHGGVQAGGASTGATDHTAP
jgi:phage baseplate assembly protein V